MSESETSEPEAGYPSPMAEKTRRVTRSYAAELTGLQIRVDTALMLMKNVKVDKGSEQVMASIQGLLRGDK